MQKTPKVAARCKHCFETLIPPDTSCVEEPLYRVLMHFFSGGFVKFLHAEKSVSIVCLLFTEDVLFPTPLNSDPIELGRNGCAFIGVTNYLYGNCC